MSCSSAPEPQEPKEELLMPAKTIDSVSCARCKAQRGVLVVVHTSYCSDCLVQLLRARFARSVITHLPPLYQNARPTGKASFLLASSGGSASASMIDMFRLSLCPPDETGPRGRQRWNRIVVGWVDFGEEADDRRSERETAMRRSAEAQGFEFWRVSVDEAFDERGELVDPPDEGRGSSTMGSVGIRVLPGRVLHTSYSRSSSHADSPYRYLLAQLPPTSHPAIRMHILHSLLTRMALALDQPSSLITVTSPASKPLPPYLLLGSSSTRIASLTIASLAAGRGYALPLLVAPFLEYRGVKTIRPLTASGKKELVWYARAHKLAAIDWDWESGAKSGGSGRATSIEALTQDFVQTLNSTHPSTVSTIARTSHKLLFPGFVGPDRKPLGDKAKKALWTEGRICPLCELPSDEAPLEWLARTSITTGTAHELPADSSAEQQQQQTAPIPVERQLCYACLTTLVSPSAISGARAPAEGPDPAHADLPAWTLPNLVRETVKGRRRPESDPFARQPRREEVGDWLRQEGWLLEGTDEGDP